MKRSTPFAALVFIVIVGIGGVLALLATNRFVRFYSK